MNCFCNPPKPADIRKSTKSNDNYGKEYFTCRESKCDFFHWVGAPIPASFGQNRNGNSSNSANIKKDTGISVRIALVKFEIGPPHNVWFSINCPNTPILSRYYSSIDESMREFRPSLKIWMFNILVYNEVVGKLQSGELGEYSVAELPRFLVVGLKKFLAGLPMLSTDPVLNLELDLMESLLPFQLDGIQFVVRRGGRALIGDEMGCGKTLQAIGVIQHYRNKWPALVILPVILLQQWKDELLKYSGDLLKEHDIVTLKKSSDRVEGRFKILLVPYSILDRLVDNERINPQMFGVVIADESHNLKSIEAKRTTVALPFLQKASVAVCLSGTPVTNRPIELFTQLNGILPSVFSDYDAFGKRYCDPKQSKFSNAIEYKGSSNESELKLILEGLVMIRRLKEDVVKSLPAKSRELRYVDPAKACVAQLTAIQKKSASIESELRNAASADKMKLSNLQRQLLLEHFKVTGLSKIPAIKEELARLVDEARFERGKAESSAIAAQRGTNGVPDISFTAEYEVAANVFATTYYDDNGPAVDGVVHAEERLTQSVLDDETVELNPRTGGSRSSSISSADGKKNDNDSDNDEDAEYEVSTKASRGKNTKKKHVLKDDKEEEEDEYAFLNSDSEEDLAPSSRRKSTMDVHAKRGGKRKRASVRAYESEDEDEGEGDWSWNVGKIGKSKGKKSLRSNTKVKNAFDEMTTAAKRQSTSPMKHSSPRKVPNATGLGKKIIVFAHHTDVMDAIEQALMDLRVDFIRIDGSVTGPQRNMLIKQFQEDDVTDVALLSVTACGTGLNLTRANVALFGELYWSPGVVLQAEDRIHRLGQKSDSVRIIYMLGRNTADDIVWDQIQRKHHVLGATVGIGDHKATHGGGMAIGKGGATSSSSSKSYNNKSEKSAPTSLPIASLDSSKSVVNPYQAVNIYQNNNPYTNNVSSSSSGSTSSSSTSYSYTVPPAAAPAATSYFPVVDGKIDTFFKPQVNNKNHKENSNGSNVTLKNVPTSFQYDEKPPNVSSTDSVVATPIVVEMTAEQKERCERNKRAALERLAQKKKAEEQLRVNGVAVHSSSAPSVSASTVPHVGPPTVVTNSVTTGNNVASVGRPVVVNTNTTVVSSTNITAAPYSNVPVVHTSNCGVVQYDVGSTAVVAPPRSSSYEQSAYGSTAVAVEAKFGPPTVVQPVVVPSTSSGSGNVYGTPHVFSTGRGSSVSTTNQGMQKANQMFSVPNGMY